MFIKPFYFHRDFFRCFYLHETKDLKRYLQKERMPRGLSIKIQPETGFTEVIGVSFTLCNPKDQFNKKEARRILETKEVEIIETKKLPHYIADKMNASLGCHEHDWQDFAWMYKYVL